jgi:hypothetical protein
MNQPLYPWGRAANTYCTGDCKLGGAQCRYGYGDEEKILFPPRIEAIFSLNICIFHIKKY